MNELYSINPCPKCGADCWQRRGGYGGIKSYYVCTICAFDTRRLKGIREYLDKESAESEAESKDGTPE